MMKSQSIIINMIRIRLDQIEIIIFFVLLQNLVDIIVEVVNDKNNNDNDNNN